MVARGPRGAWGVGRHVHVGKTRRLTPPPQGSYTHPTGPAQCRHSGSTSTQHTDTHLFARTNSLCRKTAFAAAGRCLERGRRQHAGGCLVSTRSRNSRSRTQRHSGSTRWIERLPCHSGGSAAGVARRNPILHSSAGEPARRRQLPCHCGSSAGSIRRVGLSGRPPKSPPRSIQGLGVTACVTSRPEAIALAALLRWLCTSERVPPGFC